MLSKPNWNFRSERTKDFAAGLVALVFVLTAGYLALNKFNSKDGKIDLGIGGDVTTEETSENQMSDRSSTDGSMGDVAGANSSWWVANDYNSGDIKSGNYTVVEGDTLWEIADAVYGNGAMWTQILDANAGSIGYLADGTHALIMPGQVLSLP